MGRLTLDSDGSLTNEMTADVLAFPLAEACFEGLVNLHDSKNGKHENNSVGVHLVTEGAVVVLRHVDNGL